MVSRRASVVTVTYTDVMATTEVLDLAQPTKAAEDAVIFVYAGGLLVLGVALWGLSRALAGPAEPVDPTTLVDS